MKATLEFNLPEERDEFETAAKAYAYRAAVEEIWQQIFRKRLKYSELTDEQHKIVEEMAEEYRQIVEEISD